MTTLAAALPKSLWDPAALSETVMLQLCLGHPPGHCCDLWTEGREGQQKDHWPRRQQAHFCWLSCPWLWVWASHMCLPWSLPSHHLIYEWIKLNDLQHAFFCTLDLRFLKKPFRRSLGPGSSGHCLTHKQHSPALEAPSILNKCRTFRKMRFCSVNKSIYIYKAWLPAWSYSYSEKLTKIDGQDRWCSRAENKLREVGDLPKAIHLDRDTGPWKLLLVPALAFSPPPSASN